MADGFIRIAVENMANAIKKISVRARLRRDRLCAQCFGSAGGQHACLIADTLGMETVLIHPLSGLLSAYGMGLAHPRASRERTLEIAAQIDALARHRAACCGARARRRRDELLGAGRRSATRSR